MARQLNSSRGILRRTASPMWLAIGVSLAAMMGGAMAAQPGHGRVNSAPGAPLEVSIPLRGLTADDVKVLSASVADAAAWAQAGLTLPAAMETLSVTVEPGLESSSRTVVLKSTQAVNRPVIDVLIRLSTASGARSIQSSYLVLTKDVSAGSASTVRVVRGDTLYAIALTKAVPNTDIFQVMWAIYEANPQAFMSDNMNLLRAGATLNIPDAVTMRAVDAKYARAMFVKHDQAFRARRGAGQASVAVPIVATTSTQSGTVTAPVSSSSAVVVTGDQVKLDSTSPADQMADALVANANELREMKSRVESLQKNVEELKDALQKSQAAVGSSRTAGSTGLGSAGSAGSAGSPGSPGSPGAPGAPGSIGASVVPGSSVSAGTLSASADPALAGKSAASGSASSSVDSKVDATSTAAAKAVSTESAGGNQNTSSASNSLQEAVSKVPSEVKTGLAKVKQYASDHVLGLVLGISALLALLIAFLLKRAGKNARADESDQVPHHPPGLASAFDQKLQSIDLNLSADDKPTPASGSTKTSV
jgi:pilus assembly protein FimV